MKNKEYFSSYDLNNLLESQNFSFKNINEYCFFLKDILNNNKLLKLENKINKVEKNLNLKILPKFGIIKELKFQIKEKELT